MGSHGLPGMPSMEPLGPGKGGTDPGVASNLAMYLRTLRTAGGWFVGSCDGWWLVVGSGWLADVDGC